MTVVRRGGQGGYLLIEALATLALCALALTALLSLAGVLRKSADRAAMRVETIETSQRTVRAVAQELRHMARRRWAPVGEEKSRGFVFSGSPDRVMFVLTPQQLSGLRASVVVVYQVDPQGNVLRAEGALPASATGPEALQLGPVATIDPAGETLRFAYVDRRPGAREIVTDSWSDPQRMPAAIRLDRLDRASQAPIASLRVPLLIDGEPGCAQPDKGFCSAAPREKQQDGEARGPTDRPASGQRPSPSGEQE